MPAEIILVGGAAVLANYGFRDSTTAVDAIISASSVMKEAIIKVGDNFGLPHEWLNNNFKTTTSFTGKLVEVSQYYKTFSNVLQVRAVSAEYLLAMKLMSGRQYKKDLSDIAGILLEHHRMGRPITMEAIKQAVVKLYGDWSSLPQKSQDIIQEAFVYGDYENLYEKLGKREKSIRQNMLEFDKQNLITKSSFEEFLEKAKQKQRENEDSYDNSKDKDYEM